jgi:hypothetical protein
MMAGRDWRFAGRSGTASRCSCVGDLFSGVAGVESGCADEMIDAESAGAAADGEDMDRRTDDVTCLNAARDGGGGGGMADDGNDDDGVEEGDAC